MRGYLSVIGTDSGRIPVEARVEIYRDPSDSHEILARTGERIHRLGVRDATVSRLEGAPPVVVDPRQSHIEIRNEQNSNGVTVVCGGEETELDTGLATTVSDTATIVVGYQTEFRLTVEQESRTEINVGGSVSGDVVAGDQTTVDESTHVVDSVVNRSDIGGDSGGVVEDSVVNRSTVADGDDSRSVDENDTQNHCSTHDLLFTGDSCPACADAEGTGQSAEGQKFCMFCGAEIPAVAGVCPDCGEQFPDTT